MTRFTILALTIIAASLATQVTAQADDAKAQGNRPQISQIDGKSTLFRLVVARGESSALRQSLQNVSAQTETQEVLEDMPEVADFTSAPGELWHLRPAID